MEKNNNYLDMNAGDILIKGALEFTDGMNEAQLEKFLKYKDLLLEWNQKINLTAIEDDKEVMLKHFIDSITILPNIKDISLRMIDIGTGAGFPGIPVKIVNDNVDVTLLDSLEKRIKFLDFVIDTLGLKRINAVHGRAEDFGTNTDYREKFDIVVARAVASLPVLLEYCLPFVKIGGLFIAMKGNNSEEVGLSKKALDIFGGEIQEVKEVILPFSEIKRNIILVKKLRHTPTKYPRKAGKPSKEPMI